MEPKDDSNGYHYYNGQMGAIPNGWQMYLYDPQSGQTQQVYWPVSQLPALPEAAKDSSLTTLIPHDNGSVDEKAPEHPRAGWPAYRWPAVQLLNLGISLLLGYDVSNVANIQAPIAEAFGNVELLTWVAIGYTVANACMVPLCRRLYMFGDLRYHFLAYAAVWIVGAAVAGAAQRMEAVILGRVIIGVGGAGLYQGVMLYNYSLSTAREAPRGQALIGVGFASGLLLGPVIGGAFAELPTATWRWAMYINIPVLAVLMAGWAVFLPELRLKAPRGRPRPRLARIDFVGWVLHSAFFVMLCSSLIFSGSRWRWGSGAGIVAWVITGLLGLLYAAQQRWCVLTTAEDRIFPARALGERATAPLLVATAMSAASYGISLYYTPLLFAFGHGSSPVQAARDLLPFIGAFVGSTMVGNVLLPRLRLYAALYAVGGAVVVVAAALHSQVRVDDSHALVLGELALVGAGLGLVFQTAGGVFKAMAAGDATREGDYITGFLTFQLSGVALFTAVGGCVFQNLGVRYLRDALGDAAAGASDDDLRPLLSGVVASGSRLLAAGGPDLHARIVEAITAVIGRMYLIVVAAGAVIFLCGCAMRWERLDFAPPAEGASESDV